MAFAGELAGLERALEERSLPGGTARANVAAELARVETELSERREQLDAEETGEGTT